MKRIYIQPSVTMAHIDTETIICQSQKIWSDLDENLGYGGVDEDGELTPSSRQRRTVWEDEEEEL